MKKIFFITAIISVLYSCETDFDINAPYDTSPIVYGLLDPSVDTQFIKINRTFLGTDNLSYTRINDSTHFKNVTARVEQWTNGVKGNVYQLQSRTFPVDPSDGIFYTGTQTIYYFVESSLNQNSVYKLIGNGDGKEFKSETSLIKNFSFDLKFRNYANKASGVTFYADGNYFEVRPSWKTGKGGRRYDINLRFNYTEVKNGDSTPKYFDYVIGVKKSASLNGGEPMLLKFNTESFYEFLGNQSKLKDTVGVTKRIVGNLEFIATSADETFNTFMEVSEPASSIASERPEFTNIEGGYGIFASRYVVKLSNVTLSVKSFNELIGGKFTKNMKFSSI